MPPAAPAPIRLHPADAERYARLRRRMLDVAPWAFGVDPDDDEALDPAHLARMFADEHAATFAVEAPADEGRDSPELVAAASIARAKGAKFAHRARIWGVFVEPAHRGGGLGRAVVAAAVDLARTWPGVDFVDLGVSERSLEARRLYESFGFVPWGREPEATGHEGRRYDEIHMALRL